MFFTNEINFLPYKCFFKKDNLVFKFLEKKEYIFLLYLKLFLVCCSILSLNLLISSYENGVLPDVSHHGIASSKFGFVQGLGKFAKCIHLILSQLVIKDL